MDAFINVTVSGYPDVKMPKGIKLKEFVRNYEKDFKYPVLLAKVNNQLCELTRGLSEDCVVEFLDITDPNGYRTYQRSGIFLMICAAKEVLGKHVRVVVEHSINKNYYCEIPEAGVEITDELLEEIEKKMISLAARDIVIEKVSLPIEEGIAIAKEFSLFDKAHILKYRSTTNVNFYKLDWFYDYFYGQIVPSTGYLKVFKLKKEMNGFSLMFPDPNDPSRLSSVLDRKKISKVFMESSKWARILKVSTVGELNDVICGGGISDFIRTNEGLHEKKIANLADIIYQKNKKVILVAGPSSSGKTTFSKRLALQLRVNGLTPHVISLDNYYLNRELAPLDEAGKPDFEALESIDVKAFNTDLELLLAGRTVELPRFNFSTGQREYKGDYLRLGPDDVLVIEGIHGLNDAVAGPVKNSQKFRIFISALTQLNIDDHNRIPTSDTRLIRRLVRDYLHRGFNPLDTIEMWPRVQRGEGKNIFPYQEKADAIFNSALIYEMCVLKQYVDPLLYNIERTSPQYTEARRLLKFLDSFLTITSEPVPVNSILREFIGGSCFH